MAGKQIRVGQLIAPFGVGSLYTDSKGIPHIICGLDHWYMRYSEVEGMQPCENLSEFIFVEPRLSALLGVDQFRTPPDFRLVERHESMRPNAMLCVPALRFPRWYRNTISGELRRFNLNQSNIGRPEGGGRWQPVRFIATCEAGHLSDFPWKGWIGCTCPGDGSLILTDKGGTDLSSIRVHCKSCPEGTPGHRGKSLAGTTKRPTVDENGDHEKSALQAAGIDCLGERPWLGEGANETCSCALVGMLINQTNLYFPRTTSALALPDLQETNDNITVLRNEIEKIDIIGNILTFWRMNKTLFAVKNAFHALQESGLTGFTLGDVELALKSLFTPNAFNNIANVQPPQDPEGETLLFRREEYNIIRSELNKPDTIPDLRIISTEPSQSILNWISRINRVERLRETRVFCGFDRLKPGSLSFDNMPNAAMQQLFRFPPVSQSDKWLPAVKIYGEGIYIELSESRIMQWQSENMKWLESRLSADFIRRLGGIPLTLPPLTSANIVWVSRYLLVHTFSHILINQLIFECGYSTASLRERLFVSADSVAPMAGILIYTAAGDSDGTLGGLVQLGYPDRFEKLLMKALSRAAWCSADPVCSENMGGLGSRQVNLAACHACTLLPETSCETINQGLDRAMIVGTPTEREKGFMAELLQASLALST